MLVGIPTSRWRTLCFVGVIGLLALTKGRAGFAAEWGHLSGRIVVDGSVAEPAALQLSQDTSYCMKSKPVDESLLVDPRTKGLANAVVFLESKSGPPLQIHPSYTERAKRPVELTNTGCQFKPRVVTLWTEQSLVLKNDDDIAHNMFAGPAYNTPFNVTFRPKSEEVMRLKKTEKSPFVMKCSIHAWMSAYVVLKDHPYATTTDANGRFEIRDLPTGTYSFAFWHERAGWLKTLRVNKSELADSKGRYPFEIKPEATDLGNIAIDAAVFESR